MIQLKYTCLFLPHRREADDAEAHLMCRVKWNSSRSVVSLNLGYVIDPSKWDSDAQLCMKRSVHGRLRIPAQTINAEIGRYSEAVEKVFARFSQNGAWPTVDQVRSELRMELGLDVRRVLDTSTAYEAFMREESVRCAWAESTLKKLRTVRGHMEGYPPFSSLDGFTSSGLSGYLDYLRSTCGHNDSTCHRQLGYIRWFCAYCERKGWLKCGDYRTFRPKLKQPENPVIFLTWEELMKVWTYESQSPHLNRVRDIFLFECFSSLRYSDVMALTWDQVGDTSIRVVAQKTAKTMVIELNKWTEELLSRYIDVAVEGNHVFPRIPNQVCNRYLKRIMKECGIDDEIVITEYHGARRTDTTWHKYDLVGTHAGRRTFVCNALMMGIPPEVVMQWTGHSDYRAMKPYIAIADETRAEKMRAFDERSVTPQSGL